MVYVGHMTQTGNQKPAETYAAMKAQMDVQTELSRAAFLAGDATTGSRHRANAAEISDSMFFFARQHKL